MFHAKRVILMISVDSLVLTRDGLVIGMPSVAGNNDHLWDQRSLAGSAGGRHVAQRAEERGEAWQ